jgi:diguanylate cyclase
LRFIKKDKPLIMQSQIRSRASHQVLLQSLKELDKGIIDHTHWMKLLHRSLICCDEHPNSNDLGEDAHCLCKFGQWYYEKAHPELATFSRYQTIGDLHQTMHDAARQLLQQDQKITSEDYNLFIDQAISFKLEARKLQHEIIDTVCVIDHLTGAWNRQSMTLKLDEEYERVLRNDSQCGICMMDIDHFKKVNDSLGHQVGDQALQSVIERCVRQLRSYDAIFRYGGEEFLISMPDTTIHAANSMMERLRYSIESEPITVNGEKLISLTASFGISQLTPSKTVEEAITEADHALLSAKSNGRNQICVWD